MHLPLKLKKLRLTHDLSQEDIGKVIYADARTYGYWEKGQHRPDPQGLQRLAEYYGVSVDWLTDEDDCFTLQLEVDRDGKTRIVPISVLQLSTTAPTPPQALHEIKEMLCLVVECLTKPARSQKQRSSARKATKRKKRGAQKK